MSELYCGDAAQVLQTIPRRSVQMCVTSPPYYGLRDYEKDGQIGRESSPEAYIANLVKVFDEVYRVLMDDGTLWLNIGDTYAHKPYANVKRKDLIGIPWMLAFALRERGWYLRSDIIWRKTNAMPEGAKDRPSRCYEHIFLFAKSPRYYFDYHALERPIAAETKARYQRNRSERSKYFTSSYGQGLEKHLGQVTEERRLVCRGKDVWDISTNAYRMGEHFAMFPEKLVEPCILAGSREGDTVIDPFFGSGTTGAVAKRLGRSCIGIDLNPSYLAKAKLRIASVKSKPSQENAAEKLQKPQENAAEESPKRPQEVG